MKALIVLNGEPPALSVLRDLARDAAVYAADGGAAACLEAGVTPELVAGDFDSLSPAQLPPDWVYREFPEQDRSDFEKVLGCLPPEISRITVLGGLGKRVDHLWNNLLIAAALPPDREVGFLDARQRLIRLTPEAGFHQTLPPDTTISLLPCGTVSGVNTRGLRWDLQAEELGSGRQLSQSNRVEIPEVSVTLEQGTLYVWLPVTVEP